MTSPTASRKLRVAAPSGGPVVVVEDNPTGHRLMYVRLLVKAAYARGQSVVLATTRRAIESQEFTTHLDDLADSLTTTVLTDKSPAELVRVSREHRASRTIVPDGDHLALRLGTSRGWTGEGTLSLLVMRDPRISHTARSIPQRAKMALKSAVLKRAAAHRRVSVFYLRSALWCADGRSEESGVPDPSTLEVDEASVRSVRENWGLDERFWFAIIGAVDARKNVPTVMSALARSGVRPSGLLIAGKCNDGVLDSAAEARATFERSGGKVVVIDRTLETWELDSAIKAADCVVLAHSNEGPSGILAKAALAGTRIAAAGAESLKSDALTLPTLARWSDLTVSSISAMFDDVAAMDPIGVASGSNASMFTDRLLAYRAY